MTDHGLVSSPCAVGVLYRWNSLNVTDLPCALSITMESHARSSLALSCRSFAAPFRTIAGIGPPINGHGLAALKAVPTPAQPDCDTAGSVVAMPHVAPISEKVGIRTKRHDKVYAILAFVDVDAIRIRTGH